MTVNLRRHRALICGFTAVVLTVCGASKVQADGSADALLAKHRAFVGWQLGDGSMKTIRVDGTIAVGPGVDKTSFHELHRGVQIRTTYTAKDEGDSFDEGYTGRLFWRANANGFVVPLLGDRQQIELSASVLFNEATTLLTGATRGTAVIKGLSTTIIRVEPPNGFPIDLYIDPASGAYRRAVIRATPDPLTFDIESYRSVDPGKKIIGSWRIDGGSLHAVESAAANVPVSDDDLHPPQPRATWTFGDPAPVPIQVEPWVYFQATVNGVPGRFMLDTGAGEIFLADDFATRAKVRELGSRSYSGLGGRIVQGRRVKIDSLKVGNNELRSANATAGVRFGNYDGILGYDFLAATIVDADLVKKQMMVYDPAKFTPSTNGVAFLVDLADGTPRVPITINGTLKAHAYLDTGDAAYIFMSGALYKKSSPEHLASTTISGVDGDRGSVSCGLVDSVEVGPLLRYKRVATCFGNDTEFGSDGGLVGFDFLEHFNWTIDYGQSAFVLTVNGK